MDKNENEMTLGKKIRFLRNQSEMTQTELAGELNVTRQALSNWERDINEPDVSTLMKLCCIFGVQINDLAMEAMKMDNAQMNETPVTKAKREFNKYDMAIGLFYAVGFFLGLGIFFTVGFITMTPIGWAASLFAGGCSFLVFGLTAHAIITLKRKDH